MVQKNQSGEKPPVRCRAESEETLINEVDEEIDDDFKDDAIVINDDEFKNENRDETRSMDDSSSGIVSSDRNYNEGSSSGVSHEEIDPGHMYDNQEDELMASTNDPMMSETVVAEQMEPENLSLKDELFKENQVDEEEKLIEDDESVVTVEKVQTAHEESVMEVVHVQRTNGRKRRARRAVVNHQNLLPKLRNRLKDIQIPSDLPLNIINPVTMKNIEYEKEFLGFDIIFEDDNNFPCFGFDKSNRTNDKESRTLELYHLLFSNTLKYDVSHNKNDQVLRVVKAKRGRKRKAVAIENHLPETLINRPYTRNATRAVIKETNFGDVQDIAKEPEDGGILKRLRRGRPPAAMNLFPSREKKLEPSALKLKGTRRRVQQPMEVRMQTKIEEQVIPLKKLRRGRPRKNAENIPEQNYDPPKKRGRKIKNVEPVIDELLNHNEKSSIKLKVEIPKEPKKRGRKRKVKEEFEHVTLVEKKTRLVTVSEKSTKIPPTTRITRTRRKEVEALHTIPMMKIKPESNNTPIIITYQEPQQQLQAPPLSSRFRTTIVNIRNNYVDNKAQPSFIPSRIVKPEPAERSVITLHEDTSSSNYL